MAEKLKPVKVVKGQRVKPVKLKRSAKITLALPDSEIAILTALYERSKSQVSYMSGRRLNSSRTVIIAGNRQVCP